MLMFVRSQKFKPLPINTSKYYWLHQPFQFNQAYSKPRKEQAEREWMAGHNSLSAKWERGPMLTLKLYEII